MILTSINLFLGRFFPHTVEMLGAQKRCFQPQHCGPSDRVQSHTTNFLAECVKNYLDLTIIKHIWELGTRDGYPLPVELHEEASTTAAVVSILYNSSAKFSLGINKKI